MDPGPEFEHGVYEINIDPDGVLGYVVSVLEADSQQARDEISARSMMTGFELDRWEEMMSDLDKKLDHAMFEAVFYGRF